MNYKDILDDEGEVYVLGQWFKAEDFQEMPKEESEPAYSIDELIDQYRDYKTLHEMFGDQQYKDAAEDVLKHLKSKLI